MNTTRIAIFGLGFVGSRLIRILNAAGFSVTGFSRSSGNIVDLSDDTCLETICRASDSFDAAVVTLPPGAVHPVFWKWLEESVGRRILLGTTSSYLVAGNSAIVTEESPLDAQHPRHDLEQYFLEQGGEIIRLAGLYDHARNPVNWIRKGRIAYEPRQVNLIHGDDAAAVIASVLQQERQHAVLNCADGQKHTWQDIIDELIRTGCLSDRPMKQVGSKPDKFVRIDRLAALLPEYELKDFWNCLPELAKQSESI